MKNLFLLFAVIIAAIVSPFSASAQVIPQNQEAVISFDATIVVRTDNAVDVEERIVYQTGGLSKHGIYRDISPYSSQGKKMKIKNVSVVDERGAPYQFEILSAGDDVRLKIGDPNVTFSGEKAYIIRYRATKAVGKLDNLDEIYWNATGNEWKFPIYAARAQIFLPTGANATQEACYQGVRGSTERCQSSVDGSLSGVFLSNKILNPGEGLTVAVGFPKGTTDSYPFSDKIVDFLTKNAPVIIIILIPLLTFVVSFSNWYKRGRDPEGSGVIVPQYDVPDGLTPMEVAGIVDENISAKSISAEIISLATKGYLKIVNRDKKILKFFESTDYDLVRIPASTESPSTPLSVIDRILLDRLFDFRDVVRLSSLNSKFYVHIPTLVEKTTEALSQGGYYRNLGRLGKAADQSPMLVFAYISPILGAFLFLMFFVESSGSAILVSSLIAMGIYGVFYYLSPAKTEKGVAAKEYILGLKLYLQIAEKDRLQFHNAPEKKPEVFERLLPYAMVLGVEDAWAREFKDIYTTPPSWYEGANGDGFTSVHLNNALSNFSSFATSSISATPSGGSGVGGGFGSGGGGFSGGGGGGGGGGSW